MCVLGIEEVEWCGENATDPRLGGVTDQNAVLSPEVRVPVLLDLRNVGDMASDLSPGVWVGTGTCV